VAEGEEAFTCRQKGGVEKSSKRVRNVCASYAGLGKKGLLGESRSSPNNKERKGAWKGDRGERNT